MMRLLLGVLLLLGCGSASEPRGRSLATVVERQVVPSQTNPETAGFDAPHYVWVDTAAPSEPAGLLVLLAGTGGVPANARLIGQEGALQGWHVVGLTYPDDIAVVFACDGDPDPDCMAHMRDEIVTGTDRSPHVAVDSSDSIDGRLTALLRWLAARYPREGWGAFLDGDAPRWSAIEVAGLSQGGGHAAYIATIRAVARVAMFGAPADGYDGHPAPWTALSVTPAARYYGFAHQRDPFTSIVPNWRALGLDVFGGVVKVERSAPPYGGSHMLTTDLVPATGSYGNAHPSVYADYATPKTPAGRAVFARVWDYMLGSP